MTPNEALDALQDAERNIAPLVEQGHVATCPAVGTTKACSQRCLQIRMGLLQLDRVIRAIQYGELAKSVPIAALTAQRTAVGADESDPSVQEARQVLDEISEPLTVGPEPESAAAILDAAQAQDAAEIDYSDPEIASLPDFGDKPEPKRSRGRADG